MGPWPLPPWNINIIAVRLLGPVEPDRAYAPEETWALCLAVTPANRRVVESLTALGDGRFGTRGLVSRANIAARPATVAGGIYDSEDVPALLVGPQWTFVGLDIGEETTEQALLDIERCVLTSELTDAAGTVRLEQFVSSVRGGLHVLRVEGPVAVVSAGSPLSEPTARPGVSIDASQGHPATMTVSGDRGAISAAAEQLVSDDGKTRTVTRLVVFAAGSANHSGTEMEETNRRLLAEAETTGFVGLLGEHEAAWKRRWEPITIEIPTQPGLTQALRFAQFHLLSSASNRDEAAVGARGLTGPAYRGHVFWDTDVFVVPALAAMAPGLARAALRYRWHRLDAARCRASDEGRQGARFPWESADTGMEVTPTEGRDLHGNTVPIRTGEQEEHIVADIAWAVWNYVKWTGDDAFLKEVGAEILLETARYWQSRVEIEGDGTGHLRCVIGPDEYHESIDDNAFTNVMARWNLTKAAKVCQQLGVGHDREWPAWRRTAECLVDGFDTDRGVHQQFDGFFGLEPVLATSLGEPPLPADALLGRERIQQVQVIKQADVVMLHHLLPGSLPPGSLESDLEYYLPRTAHGSSLSPAITASVLARAGRLDDAMRWFGLAARFDLDDLSGTTAGGVHLATMGGLWQAFTQGFLGVRPTTRGLLVDPHIPPQWGEVTHRFFTRSAPVHLVASSDSLVVTSPVAIDVVTPEGEARVGREITARRTQHGWEFA